SALRSTTAAPGAGRRGLWSLITLSTPAAKGGNDLRQLGWTLAWAVVFCDIGTSIYYVPGILYHDVGDRAAIFIALVTIGFLFLAQKIQEVTWRNPEGGGAGRPGGSAPWPVPSAACSSASTISPRPPSPR